MISNCVECNKEIRYSPFAFDPNSEYAEVTMSGLCSNGIDGCWELKGGAQMSASYIIDLINKHGFYTTCNKQRMEFVKELTDNLDYIVENREEVIIGYDDEGRFDFSNTRPYQPK